MVDLWPLMVNLPERRKYVHFAPAWMHSRNILVLREGTAIPGHDFEGQIAVSRIPIHVQLVQERFPQAHLVIRPTIRDVLTQVCTAAVRAAFFEARAAMTEMRNKPAECESVSLRVQPIHDLELQAGVAATFEAAPAADKIQREIDSMFNDGALSTLIAKYSYFGLDDTWAADELMREQERRRLLAGLGGGLLVSTAVALWMASLLRQRKCAERRLRESEGRFRTLANTAPVMIVASGPNGSATFFNTTWLKFTGRNEQSELGYGWIEGVHPDDRELTLSAYGRSLKEHTNCRIEYRLRRADGEYRYVTCSGVPRFEADGSFAGYIASCIDLTDIKTAQEEASARQNLESVGTLAGGIAHDFNNLLGAVLAQADLALADIAAGASPEQQLTGIRSVAIRGSEIVRQLMVYAGKESDVVGLVDVARIIREMTELLKVSVSKHAALEIDLNGHLPAVHANSTQLRRIVMNLITNASEAIGERDGVIRVTLGPVNVSQTLAIAQGVAEGEYVQLEVSDTGCGMSPETQARVFDPFFSTKSAGRGLGLAVVHGIVRGLGGAIRVASEPGKGTAFRVLLPCSEAAAAETAAKASAEKASAAAQKFTVLVVEDEDSLRQAVVKMLLKTGSNVVEAANGSAALDVLRKSESKIDVMLLDMTIPGASSQEVIAEAAQTRPEIRVILTSAYSQEMVATPMNFTQVRGFIRKPYELRNLVQTLRNAHSA
jgi:PAS domain S-box-containing protein